MNDANEVVQLLCEKYQTAVNAGDAEAYGKLFAADAIRIPPGSEPEWGVQAIARSERRDYKVARWSIQSSPIDILAIGVDWIYAITEVQGIVVSKRDGTSKSFKAMKTWLLQREATGEWLIKRQIWNLS